MCQRMSASHGGSNGTHAGDDAIFREYVDKQKIIERAAFVARPRDFVLTRYLRGKWRPPCAPHNNPVFASSLFGMPAVLLGDKRDAIARWLERYPLAQLQATLIRRFWIPRQRIDSTWITTPRELCLRYHPTSYNWTEWPTAITATTMCLRRRMCAPTLCALRRQSLPWKNDRTRPSHRCLQRLSFTWRQPRRLPLTEIGSPGFRRPSTSSCTSSDRPSCRMRVRNANGTSRTASSVSRFATSRCDSDAIPSSIPRRGRGYRSIGLAISCGATRTATPLQASTPNSYESSTRWPGCTKTASTSSRPPVSTRRTGTTRCGAPRPDYTADAARSLVGCKCVTSETKAFLPKSLPGHRGNGLYRSEDQRGPGVERGLCQP